MNRGRPKKENPKKNRVEIRLTDEQAELLQECSRKLGKTRTEVILLGIEKVKETINKKTV